MSGLGDTESPWFKGIGETVSLKFIVIRDTPKLIGLQITPTGQKLFFEGISDYY